VEDAHGHTHEERATDGARSSSAAQAAPNPVRGSPETVANLAAQIVKKLHGKATRFDIELTPHGMGTVDVRIEIQNGRVTAAMMFDNPQAAAEMKARAGELQRSLEQAGFDMSDGGLSFQARDGGEGRGWRQAQDQNDGRGMRGKAFQNAFDTANEAADIAESGALRLRRGASSSLDVRV
jgi:flagellar hook-length control protein FliK